MLRIVQEADTFANQPASVLISERFSHWLPCAVCRTLLPVNKEIPVTAALSQLLQTSFPEEYEARRQEQLHLNSAADGREAPLSIFVMSNILPGW